MISAMSAWFDAKVTTVKQSVAVITTGSTVATVVSVVEDSTSNVQPKQTSGRTNTNKTTEPKRTKIKPKSSYVIPQRRDRSTTKVNHRAESLRDSGTGSNSMKESRRQSSPLVKRNPSPAITKPNTARIATNPPSAPHITTFQHFWSRYYIIRIVLGSLLILMLPFVAQSRIRNWCAAHRDPLGVSEQSWILCRGVNNNDPVEDMTSSKNKRKQKQKVKFQKKQKQDTYSGRDPPSSAAARYSDNSYGAVDNNSNNKDNYNDDWMPSMMNDAMDSSNEMVQNLISSWMQNTDMAQLFETPPINTGGGGGDLLWGNSKDNQIAPPKLTTKGGLVGFFQRKFRRNSQYPDGNVVAMSGQPQMVVHQHIHHVVHHVVHERR